MKRRILSAEISMRPAQLPACPEQTLLLGQAARARLCADGQAGLLSRPLDLAGARHLALHLGASGSELLLFALLNAALRLLTRRYLAHREYRSDGDLITSGRHRWPLAGFGTVLAGIEEEYSSVAEAGAGVRETVELFLLDAQLDNRALVRYRHLFDDQPLAARIDWRPFPERLAARLVRRGAAPPWNRNLRELLRDPLRAAPDSLAGQVAFILAAWREWLPAGLLQSLAIAHALAREEAALRLPGPGPAADLPELSVLRGAGDGVPAFSPDTDWMASAVLIAKSVAVWLHQLSRGYGGDIRTLDRIPDAELDRLAAWGFNALWLIGIWERSAASRRIKQLMGNPEAEASAYALHAYRVAAELGGEPALADLEARCAARGIRLACDVVPNHTGIDSEWVRAHPDWFVQAAEPPYPAYRYSGPELSDDPAVGIRIEDGYWDHRDAAVVFEHVDRRSGRRRYLYHGNDGTHMPWNDTAQLNFLLPEVRQAMSDLIIATAKRFRLIRFDAAMTLARKHFRRLWFPPPGGSAGVPSRSAFWMEEADFDRAFPAEFWREVVDRVKAEAPDTLLIAEAFWLMESYFVRTLGMHRVYNSAFMNLLKQEENAKYRRILKDVLAFNPEILKRYVNFMNNPDEAPAIEQFGQGDKYFGVAVLLATLPGLPMFGHGQVEGYREKYGMEYRRAYWDEVPDAGFVAHHEGQIFPLLRRRRHFAEVADFQLYDLVCDGTVNDNVYAFSNGPAGDRQLVTYNNSPHPARGRLHHAVPKALAGREGELGAGTTLAQELGGALRNGDYCRFRDHRDGRHYLRPAAALEQGLEIELGPYQYQLFHAFQWLADRDGSWAALYASIGDGPVADLDRACFRLRHLPLWEAWQELVAPERLQVLAGMLLGAPLTPAARSIAGELDAELRRLAGRLILLLAPGVPAPAAPPLADALEALAGWLAAAPAALRRCWSRGDQPLGGSYPLLCWKLFDQLARHLPDTESGSDLWPRLCAIGLDQAWSERLPDGPAATGRKLAELLFGSARSAPPPALSGEAFAALFTGPAARDLAGVNSYQGITWFARENMLAIIGALALQAADLAAAAAPRRYRPLQARLVARTQHRIDLVATSGCRLDPFLATAAAPIPRRLTAAGRSRAGQPLRILMITPEAAPFAKTGGLGDVLGSLPAALTGQGHDVRLILPWYRSVAAVAGPLRRHPKPLAVPFGTETHRVDYRRGELNGVTVYFIDIPALFDRPGFYGEGGVDYPDNARRFALFCRAALSLAKAVRFAPDIIHAHDWQAALAPVYLRHRLWADPFFAAAGSLLTIHNLGYQGIFPSATLTELDLDRSLYAMDAMEFHGRISLLKGGLRFADRISTVSPTYCREIQTPEFGVGLDGLLRARTDRLHGLLNGLDGRHWDPARDPALPHPYSADDLAGKAACKTALRGELKLSGQQSRPLAAMVTRLDPQKGIDLLLENWEHLLQRDLQLVILGTGQPAYEERLRALAARTPGRTAVITTFDEALARRIYAASDLFLMPSRYEPCGLGQLIALRYGSVPLVHHTGGLADTIRDYGVDPGRANGFVFHDFDAASFLACLDRLLMLHRIAPASWTELMRQGMREDFSWQRTADDYLALYREIIEELK